MNMINIISKGNLKGNKSKSILIIISILLTTCLLTSIGILGFKFADGMKKGAIERAGSQHGRYRGIDNKNLETLENNISLEAVGVIGQFSEVHTGNLILQLAYADEEYRSFTNLELKEGKLPTKEEDIVLSEGYLNELNLNKNLGSSINLKYKVDDKEIEETYKLSGILKDNEDIKEKKLYSGIVSKETYLKYLGENVTYTAFVSVKNEEKTSKNNIIFSIKDIGEKLGLEEEKILINEDYLNNLKPSSAIILSELLTGIVVILSSIIVIYNIFYFSINSKIKDYGKLRAVGATKKQIKRIILKEGLYLSLIGIPIGLVLGIFLGEIVIGKILGEPISFGINQVLISIVAVISTIIAVVISLIKPIKVAANISPVEAMKYNELTLEGSNRKFYNEEMNIKKLVKANLQRNKKRTIITSISLSCSAILFVAVSIVMNGFNPVAMVNEYFSGDFSVSLSDYSFGNNLSHEEDSMPLYNELQMENPLSKELINEIKGLNGVQSVEISSRIRSTLIKPQLDFKEYSDVASFNEKEVKRLNESVKAGEFDTEEFIRNNGIAFSNEAFIKEYGNIKIGDMITLEFYDGKESIKKDFKVMAITNAKGSFMLPEEVMEGLFKSNLNNNLMIKIDNKNYDEINKYLTSITQNNKNLSISRYEDELALMREATKSTSIIGYGLVLIIFIISLMNFINTLISNVINRKKELGMLQAIGLSNKQLKYMLQREGMFYIIISFISAITFGTLGGFIGIKIMQVTGASYATFSIPMAMIVFLIILPLIGSIINYLIVKNFNKESVVDIIRYND